MHKLIQPSGRRVLVGVAVAMSAAMATGSVGRADQPPTGGVLVDANLPNFAAQYDVAADKQDANRNGVAYSFGTYVVADPVNRLLFEINQSATSVSGQCSSTGLSTNTANQSVWTSYDLDSYKPLLGPMCNLPDPDAHEGVGNQGDDASTAAVDYKSQVVFVPCSWGQAVGSCGNTSKIVAVSEKTLKVVGEFCAGSTAVQGSLASCIADGSEAPGQQPYSFLHAISWYAPTDDVVALTDNFNQTPGGTLTGQPGVAVSDYHVSSDAAGGLQLTLRWTAHLPVTQCMRTQDNLLGWTSAAYRSENPEDPAVFVPCSTRNSNDGSLMKQSSVVKIPLRPDGSLPVDPPTNVMATLAPFDGQDFIFDPRGERGYLLPVASTDNGLTIAVYDGTGHGSFIGRIAAGSRGSRSFIYGVDNATGRLYIDEPWPNGYGLTVVDGRRTPITPGYPFPGIRSTYGRGIATAAAVAPADAAHPYTRVFMPFVTRFDPARNNGIGRAYVDYITVLADRVAVSQDPPPAQIDANTYTGPIPQGAQTSSTYGANAAGYGLHSDLVGGYGGIVYNNIPNSTVVSLPFGSNQVDVALGAVQASSLRDGAGQAAASAAFDINGYAGTIYRSCTDVLSLASCVPPPQGAPGPPPGGQQSTAQEWPWPTAECSHPGPADKAQSTVVGARLTPPHPASPSASPLPLVDKLPDASPSTAKPSGSMATVDCRDVSSVTATGQYQCAGLTPPDSSTLGPGGGAPDFSPSGCEGKPGALSVAGVRTTTVVTSPDVGGVAQAQVTAVVSGIHLDLGNGTVINIDQVTQTAMAGAGGRPGTAQTSRSVVLSGLTVSQAGQPPVPLCPGPCTGDQNLLDALNALDPSHLYVQFPTPDQRFGVDKDGLSPKGSPGGYLAAVEANTAQRQGDKQFNEMNGFGGAEVTFVPAIRIVLYNPGDAQASREILDFAGVEADAELGVQVSTADTITDLTSDTTQAMVAAGVPPYAATPPGSGAPSFPGQPPAPTYHTGLLGVFERALSGVAWLFRSPMAGLQMAAFLLLLGLPMMAIRRRWTGHGGTTRGEG